eukprot:654164-Rhodomonas_salina.3
MVSRPSPIHDVRIPRRTCSTLRPELPLGFKRLVLSGWGNSKLQPEIASCAPQRKQKNALSNRSDLESEQLRRNSRFVLSILRRCARIGISCRGRKFLPGDLSTSTRGSR